MNTTTNTQELINNLLNERESEYLEFKTAQRRPTQEHGRGTTYTPKPDAYLIEEINAL
jgi:hypothetical protein